MNLSHLLFSYQGRIRRLHFWLGAIGAGLVFGAVWGLLFSRAGFDTGEPNGLVLALCGVLYIAYLYVALALQVKRAHDRDKTGWFILVLLIPIAGPIWLLIELGFLDGTPGPNRFGPSPKGLGGAAPPVAAE